MLITTNQKNCNLKFSKADDLTFAGNKLLHDLQEQFSSSRSMQHYQLSLLSNNCGNIGWFASKPQLRKNKHWTERLGFWGNWEKWTERKAFHKNICESRSRVWLEKKNRTTKKKKKTHWKWSQFLEWRSYIGGVLAHKFRPYPGICKLIQGIEMGNSKTAICHLREKDQPFPT